MVNDMWYYMPQTPEAPAGPVQPAVPARCGFVSLEVPSGPVQRLGPRGGAAGVARSQKWPYWGGLVVSELLIIRSAQIHFTNN